MHNVEIMLREYSSSIEEEKEMGETLSPDLCFGLIRCYGEVQYRGEISLDAEKLIGKHLEEIYRGCLSFLRESTLLERAKKIEEGEDLISFFCDREDAEIVRATLYSQIGPSPDLALVQLFLERVDLAICFKPEILKAMKHIGSETVVQTGKKKDEEFFWWEIEFKNLPGRCNLPPLLRDQLIASYYDGHREKELVDHLKTCEYCQETLQELGTLLESFE